MPAGARVHRAEGGCHRTAHRGAEQIKRFAREKRVRQLKKLPCKQLRRIDRIDPLGQPAAEQIVAQHAVSRADQRVEHLVIDEVRCGVAVGQHDRFAIPFQLVMRVATGQVNEAARRLAAFFIRQLQRFRFGKQLFQFPTVHGYPSDLFHNHMIKTNDGSRF